MKSLASSNRHLSTAIKRRQAVYRTIASSSAIEGIKAPFALKTAKASKRLFAKASKIKR